MAASLGRLVVEMSANLARFQSDMGKAVNIAEGASRSIKGALGALGVGISVAGIAAFIDKTIEAADRLNDLRTRTGLTGQELLVLEGAALRGGLGIEAVSEVASKLAKRMEEGARGTGDMAEGLQAMGLSVVNAQGGLKDMFTFMKEAGNRFKQFEDGMNKADQAVAIFGKGGDRLIPFIESLSDMEERFTKLGLSIEQDLITSSDKFKDTMQDVHAINQVVSRQLVAALLPHLQTLAELYLEAAKGGEIFKNVVDGIVTGMKVMATGLIAAGTAVAAFGEVLFGVIAPFIFKDAVGALGDGFEKASKRIADAGGVIKKIWEPAVKTALTALDVEDAEIFKGRRRPDAPRRPNLQAAKQADDAARKLEEQRTKLMLDALKDAASKEQELLEQKYQHNLIAEQDYWRRKAEIAKTAIDAELQVINKQITAQQQLVDAAARKGTKSKDYLEAVGNLEQSLAQRNKLERDFQHMVAKTYFEAQAAADAYRREVEDLNIELLELQGNTVEAARRRFELSTEQQRRKFTVNNDQPALALLDKVGEARVAQVAFNEQRERQGEITARLQISEERLQNSMRTGALSEIETLKRTGDERRKAADALEGTVIEMERLAAANPLNRQFTLQAEQARLALEKQRVESELLAEKFDTIFKDSFSDAFGDFVTGAKSAKEAFKDFADSVVREITKLASQDIATQLSQAVGFGTGSSPGSFLAGIFGGKSGGGGGFSLGSLFGLGGAGIGASSAATASAFGAASAFDPFDFIGAFQEGGFVPRTGLALVHKGEEIIPPGEMGGGGVVVNMTVNTPDANSFRASQGQIASQMASHIAASRRNR